MPRLHAAYAELNHQPPPADGRSYTAVAEPTVEILSVSFDHDADAVARFRHERWPMPWAHAMPDEATHAELNRRFGITGIPTMVLVGPDGTILAAAPRLSGDNLATVTEELGLR
jgi:hypothetical protein